MKIEMPVLPYADNALEPVISRETIGYHYGKHLQNYVNTLASLVQDTPWSAKSVEQFTQAALTLFGSGWAWLAQQQDGRLVIRKESNAGNPLRHHETPLLGVDVWEHAYYIDYFNRRADHVQAVWQIINWQVVADRLQG